MGSRSRFKYKSRQISCFRIVVSSIHLLRFGLPCFIFLSVCYGSSTNGLKNDQNVTVELKGSRENKFDSGAETKDVPSSPESPRVNSIREDGHGVSDSTPVKYFQNSSFEDEPLQSRSLSTCTESLYRKECSNRGFTMRTLGCYKELKDHKTGFMESYQMCLDQHSWSRMITVDTHPKIVDAYEFLYDLGYRNNENHWNAMHWDKWSDKWVFYTGKGQKHYDVVEDLWTPGQPNTIYQQPGIEYNCGHLYKYGENKDNRLWWDLDCDTELAVLCELYYSKLFVEITPPPSSIQGGTKYTVTCTSHDLYEANDIYLEVTGPASGNKVLTVRDGYWADNLIGKEESPVHYSWNSNDVCVRVKFFKMNFQMTWAQHYAVFRCCSSSQCSEKTTQALSAQWRQPRRPEQYLTPGSWKPHVGSQFSCKCINGMGDKTTSTIVLANFNGPYCQFVAYRFAFSTKFSSRKTSTKYHPSCGRYPGHTTEFDVIMPSEHVSFEYSHNLVIKLKAKGSYNGTKCLCYSYDALAELDKGGIEIWNDFQNLLAVQSKPLEIIYDASEPELSVTWPTGRAPNVHLNRELEATCNGPIGRNAALVWILEDQDGKTTRILSKYKDHPTNVPDGIKIINFPRKKKECSSNITMSGDKVSTTCFGEIDQASSWADARSTCRSLGLDLLQIKSAMSNQIIMENVGTDGYWVGLTDMYSPENGFRWLDYQNAKVNYTNFAAPLKGVNRRDPLGNRCVVFDGRRGSWHVHGCGHNLRFICQTGPDEFYGEDNFDVDKGHQIKSTIYLNINNTLEGATLRCRMEEDNVIHESTTSEPFHVTYGYDSVPIVTRKSTDQNGKRIAEITCKAYVGEDGVLSWTIFLNNKLKYLYYINLDGEVVTGMEENSTSEIAFQDIKVTNITDFGPRIEARAVVEMSQEFMERKAVVDCLAYNISNRPDLSIPKAARTILNRLPMGSTEPPSGSVGYAILPLLLLLLLALIAGALLTYQPSGKRRTGEDTTTRDGGEKE